MRRIGKVEHSDRKDHHQPVQERLENFRLHQLAFPPCVELDGSVNPSRNDGKGRKERRGKKDPPSVDKGRNGGVGKAIHIGIGPSGHNGIVVGD